MLYYLFLFIPPTHLWLCCLFSLFFIQKSTLKRKPLKIWSHSSIYLLDYWNDCFLVYHQHWTKLKFSHFNRTNSQWRSQGLYPFLEFKIFNPFLKLTIFVAIKKMNEWSCNSSIDINDIYITAWKISFFTSRFKELIPSLKRDNLLSVENLFAWFHHSFWIKI